ncbi:hypothetical protein EDC01DRAFT_789131 [Geopyxis carbonaria]|nr:hypothetical protein EDC01DRAFT_789131 [Geopyxis carbonaria]
MSAAAAAPTTAAATPRIWLITGTSSGLGHALALHALSNGDTVLATSRSPTPNPTLAAAGATHITLDPSSPRSTIAAALAPYPHIDIAVLNAAYVLTGALEDRTELELSSQFTVNVFSALHILSAILPGMRARGTGVVAMVGSMGAHLHTPGVGAYHATKAAVRSLSLTLRGELATSGVGVCCVEPGHFRTHVLAGVAPETRVEAYRGVNEALAERFGFYDGRQLGRVQRGVEVMFEVLTGTGCAAGRELPGTLALGSDAVKATLEMAESVKRDVESWQAVSESTDYPEEERFY